jgi:hypothetical protein
LRRGRRTIRVERGKVEKEGRREEGERSADREEWRLRQCGVEGSGVELEKESSFERTEMRLKLTLAYLITVTRLAEVHGLRVSNGPHAVSIVAIDPSQLLGL